MDTVLKVLRVQSQGSGIASPPWNCLSVKRKPSLLPSVSLKKRGLARTGDRERGWRGGLYSSPWYCGTEHDTNAEELKSKSLRNCGASTTDQTRVREKCGCFLYFLQISEPQSVGAEG